MRVLVSNEPIEKRIYFIRGQRVMLDRDLAMLYEVPTKRINEQVRRNRRRFPTDFMFELKDQEIENLRSHFATSSWGGRRYRPLAFTEQGVAMLSGILSSRRAIDVNIAIMRAFVRMRQILNSHEDLARKIKRLESKYDGRFRVVFSAIERLVQTTPDARRKIGFSRD